MKHVTWADIVKLGDMNPIVKKNLDELGEMPGITHAYALMAMVDELDGQLERFRLDAIRYRYLKDEPQGALLYVINDDGTLIDGELLDRSVDEELSRLGVSTDGQSSICAPWEAREQVLATLRGAGFVDTASCLERILDDIEGGRAGTASGAVPRVFRYPTKPKPRAWGYLDNSGVEWSAYDTAQMEAYARAASAENGGLVAFEEVAKNGGISGEKVANEKGESQG